MAKKPKQTRDHITLLDTGQHQMLRAAGAGSLIDYARQAFAAGEEFTLTAEDAAFAGAGFVQDMLKTDLDEGPPTIVDPPILLSLSPDSAVLDTADIVMACVGTGFTPTSTINFAGQEEPTTFVDATRVTTGVKPSLGWGEVSVPVNVTDGGLTTVTLQFSFTAATATRAKK